MPETRSIPAPAPRTVATFTILSEGVAVSRAYGVRAIVVHKEAGRLPLATLTLEDGDAAAQTFAISNSTDFEPGKKIEIKTGFRATDEETIFKGIVIRHSIRIREQTSLLIIECRDEAVKMTRTPKNKYYKDKKDSEVITDIIEGYGLSADVDDSSVQHKELVQYNATDWDYTLCRAEAAGMLVLPNDGMLKIAAPDLSAEAVLTVQYGATVHDLDAEIDARLQYNNVLAKAWSAADLQTVEATAQDTDLPDGGNLPETALGAAFGEEQYVLRHTATLPEEELQQWADTMMMRHRLAKIRGRVTIDGSALPLPGTMIEIAGVGERFEGKLFVTGVRHVVEDGDWKTTCQFGLDPQWFVQRYDDVVQPPAGALLPSINGLHIGLVIQSDSDPDGQGRILVKLPLIDADGEGTWARLSTLDAGNNRGTFFMPEVGDEVIVGFLAGDPRYAVVLGQLHSGHNTPPFTADSDNKQKGYLSREGLKVTFDDDKKSIVIETAAGNKITLSEDDKMVKLEDQGGSSIKLDADGVTVDSKKDVKVTASGGNVELTDMSGNSIKATPSGITLQGASKITLSAGQVEISGGQLSVSAAMAQFSGVIQTNTIIATAVVGTSYTPGAGNIM